MPRVCITAAFVRSCSSAARKTDYFDSRLRGFLLEVRKSGGKTFYQRYRNAQGRERQFKIGPADVLTLNEAKKRGREIAARALLGEDPCLRKVQQRKVLTYRAFIQEHYLPFARHAKRSWRTDETVLRLHILPMLGSRRLNDITDVDVARLVGKKRAQGYAAGTTNRILVLLRYTFNLVLRWNIADLSRNPTFGLSIEPEVQRQRFLTTEEAQRLVVALAKDENKPAAQSIKLLLLTGARRNEVTQSRWADVDWMNRTLLVPVAKSGRARHIALSHEALRLLQSIPRRDGNPFIFPSGVTGRPSASLFFPWRRIRMRAKLPGLRLHDLRHSFASFLIAKGISLYVVQRLLGHTQPRMTQRYAHLASETLTQAADVVGRLLEGCAGADLQRRETVLDAAAV